MWYLYDSISSWDQVCYIQTKCEREYVNWFMKYIVDDTFSILDILFQGHVSELKSVNRRVFTVIYFSARDVNYCLYIHRDTWHKWLMILIKHHSVWKLQSSHDANPEWNRAYVLSNVESWRVMCYHRFSGRFSIQEVTPCSKLIKITKFRRKKMKRYTWNKSEKRITKQKILKITSLKFKREIKREESDTCCNWQVSIIRLYTISRN